MTNGPDIKVRVDFEQGIIGKQVLGRTLEKYDLDELSQFDELRRKKLFNQLINATH